MEINTIALANFVLNWPVPLEANQVANVVMQEVGTDDLIVIAVSDLQHLTAARGEFMCRSEKQARVHLFALFLLVTGCPALLLSNNTTDASGPAF